MHFRVSTMELCMLSGDSVKLRQMTTDRAKYTHTTSDQGVPEGLYKFEEWLNACTSGYAYQQLCTTTGEIWGDWWATELTYGVVDLYSFEKAVL